ncbi:hypothetical protein [Nesterenkonia sphaerica]|uniref:hypothetical protein n=1 Tax=Nesterenkonia sphaerica TaxID=1804988 RepID=UPI0014086544|nr:hypothetical protein [Nesterenkonia sphaerica]
MFAAIKRLLITAFKARVLAKLAFPKVVLVWLGYKLVRALLGRKRGADAAQGR